MTRNDRQVVVLGSLHFDIMVQAPDRPKKGETLVGSRWWSKVGGKGCNQAVAARRHGASVAMIGCVGRDDFADRLVAYLKDADIDIGHIRRTDAAGSGMSVAIVDDTGDYGAVIVSGANLSMDESDVRRAGPAIGSAKILLLQHEVSDVANIAAARAARRDSGTVLMNAAPARALAPGLAGLVDILVVNAVEADAMGVGPVTDLKSGAAAAKRLLDVAPTSIVTAGPSGVAAVTATAVHSLPGKSVTALGTHGAGDVFVGGLAARLADGDELAVALNYANAAAALHVSLPEDRQAQLTRPDVERTLRTEGPRDVD